MTMTREQKLAILDFAIEWLDDEDRFTIGEFGCSNGIPMSSRRIYRATQACAVGALSIGACKILEVELEDDGAFINETNPIFFITRSDLFSFVDNLAMLHYGKQLTAVNDYHGRLAARNVLLIARERFALGLCA